MDMIKLSSRYRRRDHIGLCLPYNGLRQRLKVIGDPFDLSPVCSSTPPSSIVISDSFNRADSAVTLGNADTGQAWVANLGIMGVATNQAYRVTGGASDVFATIDCGLSDFLIQVTYAVFQAAQRLIFRFTDANNLWCVEGDGANHFIVEKRVTSAWTTVATAAPTVISGDVVLLRAQGNVLSLYVNGVWQLNYTDATNFNLTATKVGIGCYAANTARWDDFSVQRLP